ncbi:MAG: glycine-rich domain-containing protein, partial [Bacteroidota bacterium]
MKTHCYLNKSQIGNSLLRKFLSLSIFAIVFFAFSQRSFGQTQTFNSTTTFVVPAGVTSVSVQAWGGGGGGGSTGSTSGDGRGGGGGGAYSGGTLTGLVPGASLTITVGTGGPDGSSSSGNAPSGGNTSVGTIVANGGQGGSNSGETGGAGGAASAISGATTASFKGGNGGNGRDSNNGGGGGGSAPSTTTAGVNGSSTSGSTGANGGNSPLTDPDGNGGRGADGDGSPAATAGTSPGGGGGGKSDDASSGGDGAAGRVTLTWVCPTYNFNATPTASPICVGSTATINVTGSVGNLPIGIYTVTYNRTNPTGTALTTTMTVSTAGSGSFITTAFTASGTITITNLNSSGCNSPISTNNVASVTANPLPTPTFITQPSGSVCVGATSSYSTQAGQSNYIWTIPGTLNTDYNIISGGTTADATLSVKWLTSGSKVVGIKYTSGGCAAASTVNSNSLTVNALPAVTFSAQPGASACVSIDVTYTTQA